MTGIVLLGQARMAPSAGESTTAPSSSRPTTAPATSAPTSKLLPRAIFFTPTQPVVLPLSDLPRQEMSELSFNELRKQYPAFSHKPFDSAGFNALMLPFRFISDDGEGCVEEANAFAFLLSASLDWADGSYCARHCYFVFKRDTRNVQALIRKYDNGRIQSMIADWKASHAVGGILKRTPKGYAGRLIIYDRSGREVLNREYEEPRGYFILLGDMSVDAITYFGTTPTQALVEYLHRARCRDFQSIVDLGKAAFAEEKTSAEFRLYENILVRDPDFADVRYWWANQKMWQDDDRKEYFRQTALALNSYPVRSAIEDFEPKTCADKELVAKYELAVDQASRLVGRDFRKDAHRAMKAAMEANAVSGELLEKSLVEASANPNQYWFLWTIAKACSNDWYGICDQDISIGVSLAAYDNRYLPGNSDKDDVILMLAQSLANLGRNDTAVSVVRWRMQSKRWGDWQRTSPRYLETLARCLVRMGRYEQSIPYFVAAFQAFPSNHSDRNKMLVEGAEAAALCGKTEVIRQILRDHFGEISQLQMTFLLTTYLDLLEGRPVDMMVWDKCKGKDGWSKYRTLILAAQLDLMCGTYEQFGSVEKWVRMYPDDRVLWFLYDAYERHKPAKSAPDFYRSLKWLHGGDPWVRDMASQRDVRRLEKEKTAADVKELLDKMKDYPADRWPGQNPTKEKEAWQLCLSIPPGAVACAIQDLLKDGRYGLAKELALRYHSLVVAAKITLPLRSYANHLIHLVDQAQAYPEQI
jgi:tetratricopeptide (TPR) repeat protein